MGAAFATEVRVARGGRIKPEANIATGEVWSGPAAKELGLIDAIGTVDDYVAATWNLPTHDFGPAAASSFLGRTLQNVAVGALEQLAARSISIR